MLLRFPVPREEALASSGSYRRDIDGLRALAVLAVVAFHADIASAGGGFAGVDIFFVISGYLISGIIVKSLERETFSFADFYTRRINRIFPALAVVLIATMLLGWLVLFPPEFEALGRHVTGGAGFASNFLLWSETGYFDSKNKLLLHLWSLAVEEQYYLVWPLLLVTAWKRHWNIAVTVAAIAAASFLANIWAVSFADRTFAFYLPVTRLWELLAGSLLAWFEISRGSRPLFQPTTQGAELASVTGLGLITLTIALVDQTMPWPGALALLPVAGTILIIGPGKGSVINTRLLGNRAAVSIGLISYPLYLWHWPLLVAGRFINEGQLPLAGRLAIIIVSALLAAATYKFIETPVRYGRNKRHAAAVLLPLLGCVAAAGIALSIGLAKPRLSGSYEAIITMPGTFANSATFNFAGDDIVTPTIAGDSTNVVAIVGDSHATQYWPRFEELAAAKHQAFPTVLLLAYGTCPPFPGIDRTGISWDGLPFRCGLFHRKSLQRLLSPKVRTVVYSAHWDEYFTSRVMFFSDDDDRKPIGRNVTDLDSAFKLFENEVRGLARDGKTVYLVLPNPESRANDPHGMLPRRLPGLASKPAPQGADRMQMEEWTRFVRDRLEATARHTGAITIDPMPFVCGRATCPTFTAAGEVIYMDSHHFRPDYARHHATFMDVVLAM